MVLNAAQKFLTTTFSSFGIDPVYGTFAVLLAIFFLVVGATPGGLVGRVKALILKTRLSWFALFMAMVLTQFTILAIKSQPGVPSTKYYFLQTVTGIFIGIMLKEKADVLLKLR